MAMTGMLTRTWLRAIRHGGARRVRAGWLGRFLRTALAAGLAFGAALPAEAGSRYWADPLTGFAIGGFDPVAYFADGRARRGEAAHELIWSGVAWRFVNEGNMAAFARAPKVYAPRFGGHGAMGMARGHVNRGNPRVWTIRDDRLYLFFSAKARVEWREAVEANIARAEGRWLRHLAGLER